LANADKLPEITATLRDLPSLETKRLLLRKLRLEDAEDMLEYAVDPEIAGLGLWLPFHTLADSQTDLADTLERYNKGDLVDWAIVLKAENKMIGRAGLHPISLSNARAEVGYASNRKYWGQGYMTEAIEEIITFGFQRLYLNRIEALILPENSASMRVAEKVGMKFEGLRRECTYIRGKFDDLRMYSILRQEWVR
jgi:ribosomal-protein-alanine N-acetyltransferase